MFDMSTIAALPLRTRFMERCRSGRTDLIRNQADLHGSLGFKSLPLRQFLLLIPQLAFAAFAVVPPTVTHATHSAINPLPMNTSGVPLTCTVGARMNTSGSMLKRTDSKLLSATTPTMRPRTDMPAEAKTSNSLSMASSGVQPKSRLPCCPAASSRTEALNAGGCLSLSVPVRPSGSGRVPLAETRFHHQNICAPCAR